MSGHRAHVIVSQFFTLLLPHAEAAGREGLTGRGLAVAGVIDESTHARARRLQSVRHTVRGTHVNRTGRDADLADPVVVGLALERGCQMSRSALRMSLALWNPSTSNGAHALTRNSARSGWRSGQNARGSVASALSTGVLSSWGCPPSQSSSYDVTPVAKRSGATSHAVSEGSRAGRAPAGRPGEPVRRRPGLRSPRPAGPAQRGVDAPRARSSRASIRPALARSVTSMASRPVSRVTRSTPALVAAARPATTSGRTPNAWITPRAA